MNQKHIPQPNEVWRHYKGGSYQIITIAIQESTGELGVVYKGLPGSKGENRTWFRLLDNFLMKVDKDGTQQRFTLETDAKKFFFGE